MTEDDRAPGRVVKAIHGRRETRADALLVLHLTGRELNAVGLSQDVE
jgi:hypothetical protein